MSVPYFCTHCGHEHEPLFRGKPSKRYEEHATFARPEDTPKIPIGLLSTAQIAVVGRITDEQAHVMEVETPTKEEILAAVDKACAEAAIPPEIQPTIVSGKDGGTVESWAPRIEFQKHSEFPDRMVEAVQHEAVPATKHGEPVKKPWWKRIFHR